MTREEAARIIVNALNIKEEVPEYNKEYVKSLIKDFNSVNDEYKDYILKAYAYGIMQGNEKGYVLPQDTISRAETTAVILRMINVDRRLEFVNKENDNNDEYPLEIKEIELDDKAYTDIRTGEFITGYLFKEYGLAVNIPISYDYSLTVKENIEVFSNWINENWGPQDIKMENGGFKTSLGDSAFAEIRSNDYLMIGSGGMWRHNYNEWGVQSLSNTVSSNLALMLFRYFTDNDNLSMNLFKMMDHFYMFSDVNDKVITQEFADMYGFTIKTTYEDYTWGFITAEISDGTDTVILHYQTNQYPNPTVAIEFPIK